MRIQRRPTFRATAGVRFPSWEAGWRGGPGDRPGEAVAGQPPHPRSGRGRARRRARRQHCLVIVGFESADVSQRPTSTPPSPSPATRWVRSATTRSGRPTASAARPVAVARRRMARQLHRLRPGRHDRPRAGGRHVRDGDHLGPLARLRRRGAGGADQGPATRCAAAACCVPVHPRLHRRAGAVLHVRPAWAGRAARNSSGRS